MARDGECKTEGTPVVAARAETTHASEAGGDAHGEGATGTPEPPRTLDARELLGERRILLIAHRGEIYTLRLTRNDRLILTK